ncbi:hypothetical protein [Erythrobacter sp. EC-HK427]|uniref:hypothetical protein n=1 Tax=Erythrobacter sp. EC-HK427 TaxID=2038396 RepID=UPI001258F801|nr:hypothetical protein [Erythrobacter sp. EC-HK427]VVT01447.1 conserved exported hypothetical protein [Erythrobacter sp. EC-HK427]
MQYWIATAAAAAAFAFAAPAMAQDRSERADADFAELIENREVAGEAQSCIRTFNDNRLRVVENVGLAYRRGDTLWVARARDPRQLGPWDVPVIERFGSQLCRHDIIRTIDRGSGMFSGVLWLEDWVPYREIENADS